MSLAFPLQVLSNRIRNAEVWFSDFWLQRFLPSTSKNEETINPTTLNEKSITHHLRGLPTAVFYSQPVQCQPAHTWVISSIQWVMKISARGAIISSSLETKNSEVCSGWKMMVWTTIPYIWVVWLAQMPVSTPSDYVSVLVRGKIR